VTAVSALLYPASAFEFESVTRLAYFFGSTILIAASGAGFCSASASRRRP
jgi:hypothetical protein